MKNTFKSTGAVLAGLVLIFVLSSLTDVILERSGLMKLPFVENPLWFMLLVVLYRNIYIIVGSWLTAKLAPVNPMKHSLILAGIGLVLGIMGAVVMWSEPPHWYPVSLIILGWPCAWLGGRLQRKSSNLAQ